MGKFSIECPKCGSINTASTGLFAKKMIQCGTCGHEFNSKTNRIISKICPNCEKVFVYDQSKTKNRKCPACGESIDMSHTTSVTYKYTAINCPQCACAVEVDKSKKTGECQICGCTIDIDSEIQKQNLVSDAGISVIQYEGDNRTFVWKHPIEDFNMGSILNVHESQEAIFFLGGQALDLFGSGRHVLETENIPLLKKHYSGKVETQTPFHAEVYFINKTVQMGFTWGTDQRVNYQDPETGLDFTLGACGEYKLQVSDSRKLLVKLVGTTLGLKREAMEDEDDVTGARYEYIEDLFGGDIQSVVKTYLARTMVEKKIPLFNVTMYLEEISNEIGKHLEEVFAPYGLSVPSFKITRISLPEDEPNYKKWKELNSKMGIGRREAEVKATAERANIQAEAENELLRKEYELRMKEMEIRQQQGFELQKGLNEAQIMRAKGYSEKDVLDSEVQKAYAAGMGQFGANGGGGEGGSGLAGDMISMMMGAKMAGTMMDRFDSVNNPMSKPSTPEAAPKSADSWTCSCGNENTGKFCPECGKTKPESWDCSCGHKGNTGRFCSECGSPKPESWDCSCGHKGNKGKFCSECGSPKASGWDCSCGHKNNTGKCCPECGARRPE